MRRIARVMSWVLLAGLLGFGTIACNAVDGLKRDVNNGTRWVKNRL